jgi:L-cysteine/cystine lyase
MSDDHSARWAWIREVTPVTGRYAYLNCGWSGPLSTPVVEAMHRRLDLELEYGPTTKRVTEARMALTDRLRDLTARMLGAGADEIAVTGNTTEGVNIAVNGVALQPGDGVVTTSIEHGGGLTPAYWARERRGADLRIVHIGGTDGPGEVVERFDQAMDDRTRLVILSEISYATGQLLPLAEITRLAHARGATVVVDGAQTAGHVPIDVRALEVDAYAVPSHKWLCGPDGLGMLYVRRDRIADIDPVKVSHRAAESYDFVGAFQPLRDRVTKFEVSTMSTPVVAGTVAALEQYLESGVQPTWDRVRALTRYAEQRFEAIDGVTITGSRQDAMRTGLFVFRVEGIDPADLSAYLQAAGGVVCRTVRQLGSVRLSLHVYNVEAEIDRAADFVERAITEGMPPDLVASGHSPPEI